MYELLCEFKFYTQQTVYTIRKYTREFNNAKHFIHCHVMHVILPKQYPR